MLNNNRVKPEHGFAMIEALVTALIVAIGVSGVGVLLMRAIQGTQDSAQLSQAMWIVQDFVGRMRANPDAAKQNLYTIDAAINCDNRPAVMCAAHNNAGNSTSSDLVACSNSQMATFDIWITVCGISDDILDSPSDFIANPILTSTCPIVDAVTNECILYNVDLSWSVKLTTGSATASERTNTNNYSLAVELN